jgi:hypothetical protein
MPLKIKIDSPPASTPPATEEKKPVQASITLSISRTLGGNLLINDHKYLDIVVSPTENKISTMPKPYVERDVFDYQKDLMYDLFKGGVTNYPPQGGIAFGIVETTYPDTEEVDSLQSVLYRIHEYVGRINAEDDIAEEYDQHIEDRFTDPTDKDSTKYGEVPPYEDTPEGRADSANPTYTFAGYGYYY